MSQDSKFAIKFSLESCGFVEDMQIYTDCYGERVSYDDTETLMGLVHKWFWKQYANENSNKYIDNIEKRVDKLKQLCYEWLICRGYQKYFMIDNKLPLIVEYFIEMNCGLTHNLGRFCVKRIENEAKYHEISYMEMLNKIKFQHKYMGWK